MENNKSSVTFLLYLWDSVSFHRKLVFSEYTNQENILESVVHKRLSAIFYIYPRHFIKILLFKAVWGTNAVKLVK